MKKFYALIWAFLIAASTTFSPVSAALPSPYKDVPPNHWANAAITWAKAKKMVHGYPDGTFRPDKLVSEAEFIVMLLEAYKPAELQTFKKVNHWADPYYGFSQKYNYPLTGYTVKTNRDKYINRERVAEIIAGIDGVNYTGSNAIQYILAKKYAAGKTSGAPTIASYKGGDYLKRSEAVQFIKVTQEKGLTTLKARPIKPTPLSELPPLIPATSTPIEPDLTIKQIAALSESVGMVICFNEKGEEMGLGSAFSIGNGLFLTNYHVVEGAKSFKLITNDDQEHDIEGVVRYDVDLDLAILKPKEKLSIPSVKIGSKNMVEKGDKIVSIGSPEGLINTLSDGLVSSIRKLPIGEKNVDVIQITAPITHGSSGGALFNMKGYAIGVTSFGMETGNLNFAIAIDHAVPWINELRNVSYSSIKPVTLPAPRPDATDDGSDIQNPDGTITPPGTGEPIPVPDENQEPLEKPASVMHMALDGYVKDVILHPTKPIMYVINKEDKGVYAINYETKEKTFLRLPLRPEKLYFADNELYVALVTKDHSSYWRDEDQSGGVAIIDPETWQIKDQFETDIDPFDIVVANGFIYVSSGSGQWTTIKSYSRETKMEVASRNIRQQSYLALHPDLDKIIGIDTDSSPRDMETIRIENGQFTGGTDSPYHGDYPMNTNIKISPDGKYVFNGAGTIFTSSLQYVTDIGKTFSDVAFDMEGNRFFISNKNRIFTYDYTAWKPVQSYKLNGEATNIFYRDHKLIILSKIYQGGSIFGIEMLDVK
jgi:S1-C subfamily serine protease